MEKLKQKFIKMRSKTSNTPLLLSITNANLLYNNMMKSFNANINSHTYIKLKPGDIIIWGEYNTIKSRPGDIIKKYIQTRG